MGRRPVLTRVPTRVQTGTDDTAEPTSEHQEWVGEEWDGDGDAEDDEGLTSSETPEEEWTAPEPRLEDGTNERPANEAGDDAVRSSDGANGDSETDGRGGQGDAAVTAQTGLQSWLDTLINTIPGEILVLWAAVEGAAELYALPLWAYSLFLVLVAIATPVYVYRSIDKPADTDSTESPVQWWQEANVRWQSVSATGAFFVWVYYLGGPFQAAGLQDAAVATVLVILYPMLIIISPYYGSLLLYMLSSSSEKGNRGEAVR